MFERRTKLKNVLKTVGRKWTRRLNEQSQRVLWFLGYYSVEQEAFNMVKPAESVDSGLESPEILEAVHPFQII